VCFILIIAGESFTLIYTYLFHLVPSGRYDTINKQWFKGDKAYLFNVFSLASVWRDRMLAAINQYPELTLPLDLPKKWVVDCRKVRFCLPSFKYLSRYLYRGVLPDKDIINISNNSVTFKYREGGTNISKTRSLPVLEFLWLILQHVLPKGLQRVRDYGFLRGFAKQLHLQIQLLLGMITTLFSVSESETRPRAVHICPCYQHSMKLVGFYRLKLSDFAR